MGRRRPRLAVKRFNPEAAGRGLRVPDWRSIFELAFVILVRKAKKRLRTPDKTGTGSRADPEFTATSDR